MEISHRLKKIASKIYRGNVVADIGTDHAYIPIYLCQNKLIKKAIALDISKSSTKKAHDNIKGYNLQNMIQARESNGFEKLTVNDNVDVVIISGMGGILITNILEKGGKVLENLDTLILQPQRSTKKVREYIHKIGMNIIEDEMIIDLGKFYTIIICKWGKEDTLYNEYEYMFGRFSLKKKCPILKEYIKILIEDKNHLINKLEKTNSLSRIEGVKIENENLKEVLKCL